MKDRRPFVALLLTQLAVAAGALIVFGTAQAITVLEPLPWLPAVVLGALAGLALARASFRVRDEPERNRQEVRALGVAMVLLAPLLLYGALVHANRRLDHTTAVRMAAQVVSVSRPDDPASWVELRPVDDDEAAVLDRPIRVAVERPQAATTRVGDEAVAVVRQGALGYAWLQRVELGGT